MTTTAATEVETKVLFEATTLKRVVGNVALFAGVPARSLPILTGILLTFDGKMLTATATDLYTLGEDKLETTTVDALQPFRILVPAKQLVAALKPADAWVALKVEGDTLTVDYFEGEQRIRAIEGEYPRTEHIWPTGGDREVSAIGFNPHLLARFDKVKSSDRGVKGICLTFGASPYKPVRVTVEGYETFRGIIMPTRLT